MYKKTITYTDFNGIEREEDLYFNLSRKEIADMQLTNDGGLTEQIDKIVRSKDQEKIVKLFQKIILAAYGVKSDDGMHFYKEDPITGKRYSKDFEATAAFDELYYQLSTDADAATEFINGIVPAMPTDHAKSQATKPFVPSEVIDTKS